VRAARAGLRLVDDADCLVEAERRMNSRGPAAPRRSGIGVTDADDVAEISPTASLDPWP
jgi:hypothetical protein